MVSYSQLPVSNCNITGIEFVYCRYLEREIISWFNLSDEGVEDAIYDSYAMRKFMGINFLDDKVPDATTLLHFWHILKENHAGEAMFGATNNVLEANGLIMHGGTIVSSMPPAQRKMPTRLVTRKCIR